MRLREGIKVRKVAGQTILVPVGKTARYVKQTAVLNGTAAYMVSLMTGEFTSDDIVTKCLEVYKVEEERLRRDVNKVITVMKEAGMIIDNVEQEHSGGTADEAETGRGKTHTISGTVRF